MATLPVRFEFYCNGGEETLNFVHDIPHELVRQSQFVGEGNAYDNCFLAAVTPVLKARAQACQDASGTFCENCGSVATNILQHVMSWLNKTGDPFIRVYVCAVCEGGGGCEMELRQELGDIMAEMRRTPNKEPSTQCREVVMCKVCGETAGVKKCGGCRTVGYCSRDHQKGDWKVHKRACKRYTS